jgi:hypothetical protein
MKNKNNTLSAQNEQQKQKILYFQNKRKKNTTLSEQNEKQKIPLSEQNEKQKILHCRNEMKNKKYYIVGTK